MDHRPNHRLGRLVLAACAVSLGAASLSAQDTPSTSAPAGQPPSAPAGSTPSAPTGPNPSRIDIFTGYSYFGAHGQVKPAGINYSSIDYGAAGSGAFYFNKYVGGEILITAHPDGNNDGIYTGSAGPIFRAPMQNFTVFAHALGGAARIGGPNNSGVPFYHEPYTWGPSVAVGGGMDYDLPFLNNLFSIRLFEADYRYIHADFGPATTVPTPGVLGGRTNMSSVELSAGIVTHFGHIIPPPPVTLTCVASPTTGYPGDPITITGTALNLNPKKTANYTWTTDAAGGTITGTSNVANIDTHSATPGSYNAKGHVSEGNKPGQMADCAAPYTVKQFEPPTISCSANPSTVNPGDSSTITAQGVSPQNRPLTYSYSSTSGSVSGNTSTATLTTAGAAPGTITVTCNVVDDKGQTASSTTSVTVNAPVAVKVVEARQLCSLNFAVDKRRPARVDNTDRACLDDVALELQRSTDAKLAIVGNATSTEKNGTTLAAERAVNAKAYLVGDKGIDASRISVYTGNQSGPAVTDTEILPGATFDTTSIVVVDETTIHAQPRNARAGRSKHGRHHHRGKKAAQ